MAGRAQAWCQGWGKDRSGKVFGLIWTRETGCVYAHLPRIGTSQRSYGPHGELFFFLLKKEPVVLSELVDFGPCISAETMMKACALIGPHMMAALRSDCDSSPDPGEMWKYGCPKSPVWSGNGVEGEGSEDASSVECYEHHVDNLAFEVVGQNWSSEVISSLFS